MKKLLIVLLLAITGIATASAQTYVYKSYAYAQKNAGYNWSNFTSSNLTITINFDTDVIRINNKLNSTFTIYSSESIVDSEGENQVVCYAYDEEGLRCKVRLVVRHSGESQIYIDYNNVSWCYNVRRIR